MCKITATDQIVSKGGLTWLLPSLRIAMLSVEGQTEISCILCSRLNYIYVYRYICVDIYTYMRTKLWTKCTRSICQVTYQRDYVPLYNNSLARDMAACFVLSFSYKYCPLNVARLIALLPLSMFLFLLITII